MRASATKLKETATNSIYQLKLEVFQNDGGRDFDWLKRVFHKLLLGFTWWTNVKDPNGGNLFGGGFLGMDNVGPFDRSAPLPEGDGTQNMLRRTRSPA